MINLQWEATVTIPISTWIWSTTDDNREKKVDGGSSSGVPSFTIDLSKLVIWPGERSNRIPKKLLSFWTTPNLLMNQSSYFDLIGMFACRHGHDSRPNTLSNQSHLPLPMRAVSTFIKTESEKLQSGTIQSPTQWRDEAKVDLWFGFRLGQGRRRTRFPQLFAHGHVVGRERDQ